MEPGARLPGWLLALGLASTVLAPGKCLGKVSVPGLPPASLNWDQRGPGSINWVSGANPLGAAASGQGLPWDPTARSQPRGLWGAGTHRGLCCSSTACTEQPGLRHCWRRCPAL